MTRALVLLLLCLLAPVCAAQSAVHHCVSPDGSPVFTDQPCDSMAALRLGAMAPDRLRACPTTREALRRRVAAAFNDRDANALAGLMLWQGYGDSEALAKVARLHKAMQRPLLGVVDATGPPVPTAMSATPPAGAASGTRMPPVSLGALLVRLGGVQPGSNAPLRFAIAANAGCLWLRP